MSDEREAKADLFRELSLDAYNRVREANAAIDSKTHNMITISIGLMPLILGIFYYVVSNAPKAQLFSPYEVSISLGCGVVLFVIAIAMGVWNYRTRDFNVLLVSGFVQDHKNKPLAEVKEIAVATLAEMVDSDRRLNNAKARAFQVMVWVFMFGAIAFSIAFMILVIGTLTPPSVLN
jgi:uncharacterized membrane protein